MRAAVLGHPVAHSLSPVLHRAAYRALGLEGWTYDLFDVEEAGLARFLAGLDTGWAGLSLTMPLKRVVLDLVDHVEPLAQVVGAANTVLISGGRPTVAANTDVHGIVTALREAGVRAPRTALVLGAGATAASALAALGELGVSAPVVYARTPARAGMLVPLGARMSLDVTIRRWAGVPAGIGTVDVVVSTVPPGVEHGWDDLDAASGVLLDVGYGARPSALVARWRELGGVAVGGERMLLHQAAEQVRLMTGRPAPLSAMDAALTKALTPGT